MNRQGLARRFTKEDENFMAEELKAMFRTIGYQSYPGDPIPFGPIHRLSQHEQERLANLITGWLSSAFAMLDAERSKNE